MSLHIWVIIQYVIYEWGGRGSLGRCDFTMLKLQVCLSLIIVPIFLGGGGGGGGGYYTN